MNVRLASTSSLLGLASCALFAQGVGAQEPQIPVRSLGPVEARSTQALTAVSMLRALPDGGFFVNDAQRRQLLRFDASLNQVTVIADTAGAPLPYGQRPAGLLPYLGDSTIIVDPSTLSFVVLNPAGQVVRVMAPPRISDINQLANANLGSNAFDSQGRLIYRGGNAGGGGGGAFFGAGGPPRGGGGGGGGAPGGGGRGGAQALGGGAVDSAVEGLVVVASAVARPAAASKAAVSRAAIATTRLRRSRIPCLSSAPTSTRARRTRWLG